MATDLRLSAHDGPWSDGVSARCQMRSGQGRLPHAKTELDTGGHTSSRPTGRPWPPGGRFSPIRAALVTSLLCAAPVVSANDAAVAAAATAASAEGSNLAMGLSMAATVGAQEAPQGVTRGFVPRAFEKLQGAGWRGFAALILGFSTWVCFSLPTTPIEVAAGFVYGPVWGSSCGLFGKTAGSCAAFALVRALGRRRGWKVPEALRPRLVALRTHPLMSMVAIRLAPLPLGVKNYGLALCEVQALPFALASFVVNLPFSMMWAATGASCQTLSEALAFGSPAAAPSSTATLRFALLRGAPLVAVAVLVGRAAWYHCRRPLTALRSATCYFRKQQKQH